MELLHSKILGEGQPLFILHGFLGMGDNWKSLGMRLGEHFQVHLIDQRNHGRSFHSDVFDYEVMVDDLLHYMKHHHIEKAHLLGHSMGGKTVMSFAVSYPEKVDTLLVADISPRYYSSHHEDILNALSSIDLSKFGSRKEIEEELSSFIDDVGIRQFLLKNVTRTAKDTYGYRFNLNPLIENYEEVGVALPSLTQFNGRTLFLKGENSGYITENDMSLIMAHFPKATLVTVKNAGHWLHAENPEDFYDYVVSFLRQY